MRETRNGNGSCVQVLGKDTKEWSVRGRYDRHNLKVSLKSKVSKFSCGQIQEFVVLRGENQYQVVLCLSNLHVTRLLSANVKAPIYDEILERISTLAFWQQDSSLSICRRHDFRFYIQCSTFLHRYLAPRLEYAHREKSALRNSLQRLFVKNKGGQHSGMEQRRSPHHIYKKQRSRKGKGMIFRKINLQRRAIIPLPMLQRKMKNPRSCLLVRLKR